MEPSLTEGNKFLDSLLSIFYHKFIYYVPREIINEKVLAQLKGEIDDDFFEGFHFLDNYLGSYKFYNKDALELSILIVDKKSFLEQNTFKLVEKSKEITEFEFLVIIEKYYEFLLLFNYITAWLSVNLKRYNGEGIHLNIIGAFSIQRQYFISHLEDVSNYFGKFLDLEKIYDFSMKSFVIKYLPELISRYDKIEENDEEQVANPKTKHKKQRLELDENKIEMMILTQVFNVNEKVFQQ